jgi:hypothetical protein
MSLSGNLAGFEPWHDGANPPSGLDHATKQWAVTGRRANMAAGRGNLACKYRTFRAAADKPNKAAESKSRSLICQNRFSSSRWLLPCLVHAAKKKSPQLSSRSALSRFSKVSTTDHQGGAYAARLMTRWAFSRGPVSRNPVTLACAPMGSAVAPC